jgi:hypothetical protein
VRHVQRLDALDLLYGEDIDVNRLDSLGKELLRLRLLVEDPPVVGVRPPLDAFRRMVQLEAVRIFAA